MAQERTFTLIGNFRDNITPKLKKITNSLDSLNKSLENLSGKKTGFTNVAKGVEAATAAHKKLTEQVKVLRSEVSQTTKELGKYNASFGQSVQYMGRYRQEMGKVVGANKTFVRSSIEASKAEVNRWEDSTRSLEGYLKAQQALEKMARGGPKGGREGGDMLNTLLQANALTALGDAIAEGFNRGMSLVMKTITAIPNFFMKHFKAAMEDEMSDIKAQAGMMGALNLAGYKGGGAGGAVGYGEAGKFYKKIDQAIAEEIRTSAAPTGMVIELQRYTSDTLVPLLMKAQGIEKGADVRKVDPNKISEMSKGYAGLLGQIALLAQGTGSATFRVAQGVEGLITRGKIDTTMDFFTDNVLLMNALQKAGFAGGVGGGGLRVSTLTSEAERLAALKKALQVAMPKEGIEAMSTSMTGVMQALGDTISNPSVGLFGMASTFTEQEQTRVNAQLKRIFDARYIKYGKELEQLKSSGRQDEQTQLRIKQLEIDRRKNRERLAELTKQGEEKVTTPFKAFSLVFGQVIANFTKVLNAIGPIWNRFATVALDFTDKIFGPLAETLGNIASDMNKDLAGGKERIPFHMGRVVGEIFKSLGDALGTLAHLLGDPKGPMSKAQEEFYKGFMAAFQNNPELLAKAKKGIADGIYALLNKLKDVIITVLTAGEIRPLVLTAIGLIFGPPVVLAVISGVAPLMLTFFASVLKGLAKKVIPGGAGPGAEGLGRGLRLGARARLLRMKTAPILRADLTKGLGARTRNLAQGARTLPGKALGMGKNYTSALVGGFKQFGANIRAGKAGLSGIAELAPLRALTSGFSKFGGLLQKGVRGLGRFGMALTVVVALMDLITNLFSGKDLASSLGAAAGPAFGTILGFALGGPIGAVVGSWLGGQKPVIDFFTGTFQALGNFMAFFGPTFMGILESLGRVFQSLWNVTIGLIPGFQDTTNASAALTAGFYVVKGILLPIAAALWALEQSCNGLKLAFLVLEQWVNNTFQGGNRAGRIQAELDKTVAAISSANTRLEALAASRPPSSSKGDVTPRYSGGLGDAINSEMRHKPPGSNLVIANSSETVIPAAGGFGMENFVAIMSSVSQNTSASVALLSAMRAISSQLVVLTTAVSKNTLTSVALLTSIKGVSYQTLTVVQQIPALLEMLNTTSQSILRTMTSGGMKVSFMIGTGGKGGPGAVDAFNPIASSYGLQITSGYRPGDPGYHGINRARDYSNGTGPTPQMMQFATFMAGSFGGSLAELIYTPLGFSIKNGRVVPPYAQAGHYNHVHVAYGLGAGSPAFFSSASQARDWEKKMAPTNASIATVTGNSAEGFGSGMTLNSPITIYQQPGQNSEELASIVAMRLWQAVEELRNHG